MSLAGFTADITEKNINDIDDICRLRAAIEMGRICAGRCQYHLCCAGLSSGGDAVQLTVLPDLDVLRMVAPGTAVEIHQHAVHSAVYLRDRQIFLSRRLAGAFDRKDFAHHCVILIAHPREHPKLRHVKFAVDKTIVAQMHARDLAKDREIGGTGQLHDLG